MACVQWKFVDSNYMELSVLELCGMGLCVVELCGMVFCVVEWYILEFNYVACY